MGPPITYQLDGKQYVAVMGGTGPVQPRNGQAAPATPPQAQPDLPSFLSNGEGHMAPAVLLPTPALQDDQYADLIGQAVGLRLDGVSREFGGEDGCHRAH